MTTAQRRQSETVYSSATSTWMTMNMLDSYKVDSNGDDDEESEVDEELPTELVGLVNDGVYLSELPTLTKRVGKKGGVGGVGGRAHCTVHTGLHGRQREGEQEGVHVDE